MIKAIITDVDGVIVGKQKGVNFPLPHTDVIDALQRLHQKGIPVVLCTAKFNHAILGIIDNAKLSNPHITDGGALLIDPLDHKVIKQHTIADGVAGSLIKEFVTNNLYVEVYTPDAYFIQKDMDSGITKRRAAILQEEPTIVDLPYHLDSIKGTTIKMQVITPEVDKTTAIFNNFSEYTDYIWTEHPSMPDMKIGVLTAKEVSKKSASVEVVQSLGISFDEILGVGDTAGDWSFMQLCKYVAVTGNVSKELQEKAQTKDEGNYCLAPSVEENGFLDILKYFNL